MVIIQKINFLSILLDDQYHFHSLYWFITNKKICKMDNDGRLLKIISM